MVLLKNSLNTVKNYSQGYYMPYPFIPTNPLLATMIFFFFLNLVRSSSPKPQHIEFEFLCKAVKLQM